MITLPASRIPDPSTAPRVSWGIIGPGWIAARFAAGLKIAGQHLAAVGSRSLESASTFSAEHGVDRAYGSYADLVADPAVDVVYVATPHPHHLPHAKLALEAGKHVLVEKPIGLDAAEATEIASLAAARGLFCAEAMWTFFLPKFDVIRQLIDTGAIGDVHTLLADHGEWFPATHRITRADLAGGPLLDLGTYTTALAGWVLGEPAEVITRGAPSPHGVNGQLSTLCTYPNGAEALLHTTILSNTPIAATIAGSAGTITVPGVWFRPGSFDYVSSDHAIRLRYEEQTVGYDALAYEAAEVARRVTAGETGTPYRPMADSIATLVVMNEMRRQTGIVFG